MKFNQKIAILLITTFCHITSLNAETVPVLKVYDKIGETGEKGFDKGNSFLNDNNIEEANKYFTQYIENFNSKNSTENTILEYLEIGMLFKNKLFYANALDYYFRAKNFSEQNDIIKYNGKIFNRIGDVYYDQENYENALKYYVFSKNVYYQLHNEKGLAISYNNIGEIYRFTKKFDEALIYYNKSVELNLKYSNHFMLAYNYNNIGLVYVEMKDYSQGLQYLLKSKSLIDTYGDNEKKASIGISIGYYYYSFKDFKNAIEYYKYASEANLTGSEREIIVKREAFEGLHKSYSAIYDYKKAYIYYEKYTALNNLIFNNITSRKLVEIHYKNKLKKQQSEILLLHEIVDLENKRKTISYILLYVSIGLILILAYLFVLIKRSLMQKTKLFKEQKKVISLKLEKKEIHNQKLLLDNQKLEVKQKNDLLIQINLKEKLAHKKQELSLSTLYIINKNEILLKIKSSIIKLKANNGNDPMPYIVNSIAEIDNSMNLDKDWKNFKLHFENVHQGFFKKLLKAFPKLTSDELKMCAYLKINLSSKEIAQILNITAVAINKRRNRLRKKLNLSSETDLVKFFTNEKY